ncbi:sialidase family protein [Brachyspira pilosicoli]|uniref:sialidase family protein n=1 Tax=Brachyspira pilosicoli TaxID=52584 RepID=UPI00249220C9|nr:sialidase family protein [Brachyspira pilosicoli]
MMKKISVLIMSAFLLIGCGTDLFYSSFYIRNTDLKWMLSPSAQSSLNYKSTVLGTGDFRFNSPSIIATPDNYILFLYERRNNNADVNIIGVNGDSSKRTDVYAAVSKNAENFIYLTQLVGGSSLESHGSPIAFVNNVNNNSEVIVLAVGGNGFADSQDDTPSVISKSVSIPKTEYTEWTEWEDLDTNIFKPLLDDKYNRFYTSPDSGITLRNGTLACIIDYKKKDRNNAEGFAILYSTDNGTNWKIGAKTTYQNHRFAKIIAERKDGKLLIAAAENSDNDYNKQADLAWFLADSLEGNISSFTVNGLPLHNCGSTAGGKITLAAGGYSKEAIILLHSYTNRETINPNGVVNSVKNANALYISFNDGQNWEIVTNIFYPLKFNGKNYIYDDYDSKTSFRQSMRVLKDGTIAAVSENGNYVINTSGGADTGFRLVYRRFSLEAVSGGKYRYEGL